jgi:hypothetical protein
MHFQNNSKYQDRRVFVVIALCFVTLLLFSCATNNVKDTKEAQVTLDILKNAIGKNIDGAEVSLIKNVAVVQPEIVTFNEDDAIYLTWKTLGIELLFESSKLRTVFLYSNNKEFSAYCGSLPQGLLLSDTRLVLERKLGIPDYIGGANVIDVWVRYEKFKLGITYKTLDLNDMTAGIDHITMN